MYYITMTARRKNGKRHIASKANSLESARENAERYDKKSYKVEIYTGSWELVEEVEEDV